LLLIIHCAIVIVVIVFICICFLFCIVLFSYLAAQLQVWNKTVQWYKIPMLLILYCAMHYAVL